MQLMMDIDTTPIQRFMQRVAKMNQLKQTDIRLSIAEAGELSATLAALLAYQIMPPETSDKAKEKLTISPSAVFIDGGSFKKG